LLTVLLQNNFKGVLLESLEQIFPPNPVGAKNGTARGGKWEKVSPTQPIKGSVESVMSCSSGV